MSEIEHGAANVGQTNRGETNRGEMNLGETGWGEAILDEVAPSATGIDEFLTGYIVRPGLCLNFDVTDRIRLGGALEECAGARCLQRRLCLSRSLRRHLDEVPGNSWLRRVFDEALLEMGNGY